MKFKGNLLEIIPLNTEKQLLQFNTENGLLKLLVSDSQFVKYFVNEQGVRRGSSWELTVVQLLDEYERELSFKLTEAKEVEETEEATNPHPLSNQQSTNPTEVAYGDSTPIKDDHEFDSPDDQPTSTPAQQQDIAFQATSRANEDVNAAQQFDESYHPKENFGQDIINGGYDEMLTRKLSKIDPEATEIDPLLAGIGLGNSKPSFNTGKKVEQEDTHTATFGSRDDISKATDEAEAAELGDEDEDENNGYVEVADDDQLSKESDDTILDF